MPICYNGRTKKRAVRLIYLFFYTGCVQCIALIFLFRFAIIFVLNPLGLTILLANLAGVFYAEDECLNKYPRQCG